VNGQSTLALCSTVSQEGFATEGGVILQKVVDVPDPIVFFSGTCALSLSIQSRV